MLLCIDQIASGFSRMSVRILAPLLCGLILLLAGCETTASSAHNRDRPVRLQVAARVPLNTASLPDDDLAEAFAYRVITSLHEQGFRGRIRYLDEWVSSDLSRATLEINLIEWRVNA